VSQRARPHRGEVWLADFGDPRGHEQGGRRPGLVVSVAAINEARSELVTMLPITTRYRDVPGHVVATPPSGGLNHLSVILCDQTRTITQERLNHRLGALDRATLAEVDDWLRLFLGL
jgi:mRNA interferase MazF